MRLLPVNTTSIAGRVLALAPASLNLNGMISLLEYTCRTRELGSERVDGCKGIVLWSKNIVDRLKVRYA
jgi:hypothetical protein